MMIALEVYLNRQHLALTFSTSARLVVQHHGKCAGLPGTGVGCSVIGAQRAFGFSGSQTQLVGPSRKREPVERSGHVFAHAGGGVDRLGRGSRRCHRHQHHHNNKSGNSEKRDIVPP